MAKSHRTRLGIIFGGKSGEHEISLKSAVSVIRALDPNKYEITAIGITKEGRLAGNSEIKEMLRDALSPGLRAGAAIETKTSKMRITSDFPKERAIPRNAPEILFPLLHGPFGEDGTVQGLLEIVGAPYVGCGVLASAVGMDKDIMKRLLLQAGLPIVPFRTILSRDLKENMQALKKSISQELGYPMFSKPANLGSSVGVRKIHSHKEFEGALEYSAQFDRKIVVEKAIDGREMECAILGNDEALASVVGEVIPAHEFYDYDAKYLSPDSRLEIPARINDGKREEIRDLALKSFHAIDASGLARVDFFLERGSGRVWLNEINTMPGFTPISMYAKLWAASGVSFEELVRRLIGLGEERYRERNKRRISIE